MQNQNLEKLLGVMVNDLGAANVAALVIIGDKLGLYRALAEGPPATSEDLARRTGTHERYIREWLAAQAASGYVTYDRESRKFLLTPEQAAVFADEDSPVFMAGGYHVLASVFASEPQLTEAFRTGKGISWGDHCSCLFCGTERFFRPGYRAHLVPEWLPALDGVVARLEKGVRVADVGCGHGASTLLMADAFPKSEFIGIDFHDASIEAARKHAGKRGNVRFEVGTAQSFSGEYDFVTMFDALHDMGDPVGAASNVRQRLKPGGTFMIVEPMAADTMEENLNPLGRVFYAASTAICVPGSLSQEGRAALGAQAGEKRLSEVMRQAGFAQTRRAAQTPFNMVLEARA